jgi:hypothetical protein
MEALIAQQNAILAQILKALQEGITSEQIAAMGFVQLDSQGMIPEKYTLGDWVGGFTTLDDATVKYPNGIYYGRYVLVGTEMYFWNTGFSPAKWSAANISAADYMALTPTQKAGQPTWNIV